MSNEVIMARTNTPKEPSLAELTELYKRISNPSNGDKLQDLFKKNLAAIMTIVIFSAGIVRFYYTDQAAREKNYADKIDKIEDKIDAVKGKYDEKMENLSKQVTTIDTKLNNLIAIMSELKDNRTLTSSKNSKAP